MTECKCNVRVKEPAGNRQKYIFMSQTAAEILSNLKERVFDDHPAKYQHSRRKIRYAGSSARPAEPKSLRLRVPRLGRSRAAGRAHPADQLGRSRVALQRAAVEPGTGAVPPTAPCAARGSQETSTVVEQLWSSAPVGPVPHRDPLPYLQLEVVTDTGPP
ncbi:hypothetical protein EVAR_40927_1 [Eumeta japonica]|uniref:Uncharacterized protein n=1 Tax=Eumeta variegata TaxID=151549 RepID=A0A4C1X3Q7_EUMVA|nr:hypothetical protein EVAR_40927_1 [Eumeta japonica]